MVRQNRVLLLLQQVYSEGGEKMKKWIVGNLVIGLVFLFLLLPLLGTPVSAATTATVVVNATPAYVTISNSPSTYGFGTVQTSTNYSTGQAYFNITNGSSVNIDIAISCNATWLGGTPWTHSDAGTPGADTAVLAADPDAGSWHITVKNGSPNDLYNNISGNQDWGIRLATPTSFSDGTLKTNTITLTASAH